MNAPFCPVSRSQPATNPRGLPTRLPSIPMATDLPSLIRAVNIMRDILRTLTTSLTVNNTFIAKSGRPPKRYGKVTYQFSPYPDWYQRSGDTSIGYVYYKSKTGKDSSQRAYVDRINQVVYRNNERDNDNNFYWTYFVPLDAEEGESNGVELFEEDFFERVVNVKWGAPPQQGLVAEYPVHYRLGGGGPDWFFEGSVPTAIALETGQSFSGVNMGASGFGITVLTKGLVCFGKPAGGEACFVAAPDFDLTSKTPYSDHCTLKRRTRKGTWETVGGGVGLMALSFAGEAFFAVYKEDFNGPNRIESSIDGKTWKVDSGKYSGDDGGWGGNIANNGVPGKSKGSYVGTGWFYAQTQPDDLFSGDTPNMMWVRSPGPQMVEPPPPPPPEPGEPEEPPKPPTYSFSWQFGKADGMEKNPGAFPGIVGQPNTASMVAGGPGKFVAAAIEKFVSHENLPAGQPSDVIWQTAAAAKSSSGGSWTTEKLPGVYEGFHKYDNDGDTNHGSYGTCTTYVRGKSADKGYFLIAAWGSKSQMTGGNSGAAEFHFEADAWLFKSGDGSDTGWKQIRTTGTQSNSGSAFLTLSTIDRKIGKVERI